MVFFLDNYILAPFFLLFNVIRGFSNKLCENNTGICVFLDFMISHMNITFFISFNVRIGFKLTSHEIS